jgi:hypothetical protein
MLIVESKLAKLIQKRNKELRLPYQKVVEKKYFVVFIFVSLW